MNPKLLMVVGSLLTATWKPNHGKLAPRELWKLAKVTLQGPGSFGVQNLAGMVQHCLEQGWGFGGGGGGIAWLHLRLANSLYSGLCCAYPRLLFPLYNAQGSWNKIQIGRLNS